MAVSEAGVCVAISDRKTTCGVGGCWDTPEEGCERARGFFRHRSGLSRRAPVALTFRQPARRAGRAWCVGKILERWRRRLLLCLKATSSAKAASWPARRRESRASAELAADAHSDHEELDAFSQNFRIKS